jgi:acyl-CoA reductase-like NAD-dependent aldehyde dehydrogenase
MAADHIRYFAGWVTKIEGATIPEGYVALGRDEGATVVAGGGRPDGLDRGFFVEPTVLTGVLDLYLETKTVWINVG